MNVNGLTLGISPCPNDTFVFHDAVHPPGGEMGPFDLRFDDIADLNAHALAGSLDVVKISAALYPDVAEEYALLRAGGALGHGVGPLLVANRENMDLANAQVALPGATTTAALLFHAYSDGVSSVMSLRYDKIMAAVTARDVDAGVIIHEGRFTYQDHGLKLVADLGAWWERTYGLAIPLGVVVAKRSLGRDAHAALNATLRESVQAARQAPERSAAWVAQHAQELKPEVRQQHIDLYVNAFSEDVGAAGEAALKALWTRGRPDADGWRKRPLFLV
jgi:1,4-dihydroxy-6-naphthoate synthase